ncbi:MAG TPA: ribosomal protein S18-alanine N-acetyltransferase [Marmoricola sp.]|nr:ribosomal protein S18-alanine N-acetyltransferase [Marmoricola sp.]
MSPPPDVGPAATADVPALVRLEETCLGQDAWSVGLVAEGVAGSVPTVSWLVARLDGDVVGLAVVSSVPGDVAELQQIAVDPACRRRGIASALVAAVVERASGEGCDRLLLEVREDNAGALALYADRGFVEVDRRPRYYRDGAAAVVLRLPLGRGCGGRG